MSEVKKKVDKMLKDYIIFTFFFLYYLFNYQALKLCDPYMGSLVRIRVNRRSTVCDHDEIFSSKLAAFLRQACVSPVQWYLYLALKFLKRIRCGKPPAIRLTVSRI
jgi:hypothetical protein